MVGPARTASLLLAHGAGMRKNVWFVIYVAELLAPVWQIACHQDSARLGVIGPATEEPNWTGSLFWGPVLFFLS